MTLTVSKLAAQAGLSPDTIRYYERVGLLPQPRRGPSGYRLYQDAEVERLRFIKGAQHVGLRLREIRELLQIRDRGGCPCGHTESLLRSRIAEVDAELNRLRSMREELIRMAEQVPAAPDAVQGPWPCEREFVQLGRR